MKNIAIPINWLHTVAKNRPSEYLEDVMSKVLEQDETYIYISRQEYDYLKAKYSDNSKVSNLDAGVGTELKKLLSKIGIKATPNCSCNKRAELMDTHGIEWCENNIDTIVGWLREEATKRQLPFVDVAGKLLVKRAIRNAKKQ